MPKLASHQSRQYVKMILIGDSGSGKTGSLESLVRAGYKLHILDMDNGLDSLRAWVEKKCPDKMENVDYETLRDAFKMTSAGPIVDKARAYIAATKLLTKWSDGSDPSKWGPEHIMVIDSTSSLGKACLAWAESLSPNVKDKRQWFFTGQQSFEKIIQMVTSMTYTEEEKDKDGQLTGKITTFPGFDTNVIVIAHVNYKDLTQTEDDDKSEKSESSGPQKGYPTAVGSALGPIIPRYFNTMVQCDSIGTGKGAKKIIRTLPTGVIDLKNPAPFRVEASYPIDDGLAKLFEALKNNSVQPATKET